ncbi:hypothetical protein HDU97_007883 [Phlyctochytrium planicorne]|nr:hypothetical protein HDU97_007883 [Phlyctochytrium planicorne]
MHRRHMAVLGLALISCFSTLQLVFCEQIIQLTFRFQFISNNGKTPKQLQVGDLLDPTDLQGSWTVEENVPATSSGYQPYQPITPTATTIERSGGESPTSSFNAGGASPTSPPEVERRGYNETLVDGGVEGARRIWKKEMEDGVVRVARLVLL